MPRRPKPWYRKGKDAWYVKVDGRQVRLAAGKDARDEAHEAFYRLMADPTRGAETSMAGVALGTLAVAFLEAAARDVDPSTREFYERHVGGFATRWAREPAAAIRPHHVTRWLDEHAWGPTTRRGAIASVKRLYSWAWKQGHLDVDPLRGMEKPTPLRRVRVMDQGQAEAAIDAYPAGDPFRDFLVALKLTGARPGHVARVEARHYVPAAGAWALPGKTTRRTGKIFPIYLVPAMVEMHARLAGRHPEGPIFRNAIGTPWTRHTIAHRFGRLRERLGWGPEATAYALRHGFATNALERGVPIATVAELLGHTSTAMTSSTYSHLGERKEHMRREAARAVGDPPSAAPGTPGCPPPGPDGPTDGT